jgi:hypothetical protein
MAAAEVGPAFDLRPSEEHRSGRIESADVSAGRIAEIQIATDRQIWRDN